MFVLNHALERRSRPSSSSAKLNRESLKMRGPAAYHISTSITLQFAAIQECLMISLPLYHQLSIHDDRTLIRNACVGRTRGLREQSKSIDQNLFTYRTNGHRTKPSCTKPYCTNCRKSSSNSSDQVPSACYREGKLGKDIGLTAGL